MLLNNVEIDLKTRLEKKGITQKELAGQKIGRAHV